MIETFWNRASWRRRRKRSHPVDVDAFPLAGSLEGSVSGLDLSFEELPLGVVALDLVGIPLSEETLTKAKNSDVVLLGAIGWYKLITVFPQLVDSTYDHPRAYQSPSGKLVQIEHALTAVGSGQTSLEIKASNGVVIATEKKLPSILVDEASLSFITFSCGQHVFVKF
ncbi:hypothetical protein HID58_056015 [Brassica napus]|uniref:BnaC03g57740D protein n=2 Tax=Brassica napus TaxID=3708 RepID=A0A078FFR2_BRANA|nr:hypothetical protein HID58_056015 [Brassica napus]CAF1709324.1 unnamed protein product [Brassica napus]CDY11804.1 BnaC03g57740D [Brassica napus]